MYDKYRHKDKRFTSLSKRSSVKYPKNKEFRNGFDEIPLCEKMDSHMKFEYYYNDYDKFTLNYGVLNRFINSKVGQKWDDVKKELLSLTEFKTNHRAERTLDWCIYSNKEVLIKDDGSVYAKSLWDGNYYKIDPGENYVHPETGLICRTPDEKKEKYKRKDDIKTIQIGKTTYLKEKSNWFRVEMKILNDDDFQGSYSRVYACRKDYLKYEALKGCVGLELQYVVTKSDLVKKYGKSPCGNLWIPKKKQPVNKKDIKKINHFLDDH